ncbi:MAG: cob(I)yrinic acid a,c-diamide adenosyltransferase, partial [Nonomuraea muscovyensis]|nr:cob(I)yrinic acid a,c-diamide adenosyltransferase [Nonomuraea muscovyensis]
MTRQDKDKPVVLSRIYTRTGDDGTTTLGDMSRTAKTDTRLAAYADVEEANAHLGLALSHGTLPAELAEMLTRVQNELFDVGADLCTPVVADPEFPPLRVEQSYIDWLEEQC